MTNLEKLIKTEGTTGVHIYPPSNGMGWRIYCSGKNVNLNREVKGETADGWLEKAAGEILEEIRNKV